jgi:hypothetical protein
VHSMHDRIGPVPSSPTGHANVSKHFKLGDLTSFIISGVQKLWISEIDDVAAA